MSSANKPHDIASLRRNYALQTLSETDVLHDPISQFAVWFEEALNSRLLEPNAMTLATATREGRPSARIVLLKGFDKQGFVFYTNYKSRKGEELAENPQAALLFTWLELERQIRIEGVVEKVTPEESKTYFQSRPKDSQIGAWASPQSRVVEKREALEKRVAELRKEFSEAKALPLPPFWGGYRLKPSRIEFWQGRESRLHDRICYTRVGEESWKIERLAP
jgi:pyridoxamine 5'-phosphate oxidase